MRYHLAPIFCRPWLLNELSKRLIESHYENNYRDAPRRLNAISEKPASLMVGFRVPSGEHEHANLPNSVCAMCVDFERRSGHV